MFSNVGRHQVVIGYKKVWLTNNTNSIDKFYAKNEMKCIVRTAAYET